jgi:hypothetical protein
MGHKICENNTQNKAFTSDWTVKKFVGETLLQTSSFKNGLGSVI